MIRDLGAPTVLARLPHIGRDRTPTIAATRALVLAPHADDETLGCGATILRKTDAGTPVWVVVATGAGTDRETEAREACRRLGVPSDRVVVLDLEDGHLGRDRDALAQRLVEIARAIDTEEVFVSSGLDGHDDHRALQAVAVELKERGALDGTLYEYPIWFWSQRGSSRWARRVAARAAGVRWRTGRLHREVRPTLVRTAGLLHRKRYALDAHASQMIEGRREEGAQTLSDVANGAFLRDFFGDFEVFFRITR